MPGRNEFHCRGGEDYMAVKGGGFKRRSGSRSEIPTSSMADIAFLLLIFFMVTTVFRKETKRDIDWAEAEATRRSMRSGRTSCTFGSTAPVTV